MIVYRGTAIVLSLSLVVSLLQLPSQPASAVPFSPAVSSEISTMAIVPALTMTRWSFFRSAAVLARRLIERGARRPIVFKAAATFSLAAVAGYALTQVAHPLAVIFNIATASLVLATFYSRDSPGSPNRRVQSLWRSNKWDSLSYCFKWLYSNRPLRELNAALETLYGLSEADPNHRADAANVLRNFATLFPNESKAERANWLTPLRIHSNGVNLVRERLFHLAFPDLKLPDPWPFFLIRTRRGEPLDLSAATYADIAAALDSISSGKNEDALYRIREAQDQLNAARRNLQRAYFPSREISYGQYALLDNELGREAALLNRWFAELSRLLSEPVRSADRADITWRCAVLAAAWFPVWYGVHNGAPSDEVRSGGLFGADALSWLNREKASAADSTDDTVRMIRSLLEPILVTGRSKRQSLSEQPVKSDNIPTSSHVHGRVAAALVNLLSLNMPEPISVMTHRLADAAAADKKLATLADKFRRLNDTFYTDILTPAYRGPGIMRLDGRPVRLNVTVGRSLYHWILEWRAAVMISEKAIRPMPDDTKEIFHQSDLFSYALERVVHGLKKSKMQSPVSLAEVLNVKAKWPLLKPWRRVVEFELHPGLPLVAVDPQLLRFALWLLLVPGLSHLDWTRRRGKYGFIVRTADSNDLAGDVDIQIIHPRGSHHPVWDPGIQVARHIITSMGGELFENLKSDGSGNSGFRIALPGTSPKHTASESEATAVQARTLTVDPETGEIIEGDEITVPPHSGKSSSDEPNGPNNSLQNHRPVSLPIDPLRQAGWQDDGHGNFSAPDSRPTEGIFVHVDPYTAGSWSIVWRKPKSNPGVSDPAIMVSAYPREEKSTIEILRNDRTGRSFSTSRSSAVELIARPHQLTIKLFVTADEARALELPINGIHGETRQGRGAFRWWIKPIILSEQPLKMSSRSESTKKHRNGFTSSPRNGRDRESSRLLVSA